MSQNEKSAPEAVVADATNHVTKVKEPATLRDEALSSSERMSEDRSAAASTTHIHGQDMLVRREGYWETFWYVCYIRRVCVMCSSKVLCSNARLRPSLCYVTDVLDHGKGYLYNQTSVR